MPTAGTESVVDVTTVMPAAQLFSAASNAAIATEARTVADARWDRNDGRRDEPSDDRRQRAIHARARRSRRRAL
jgi:hypothetical protein